MGKSYGWFGGGGGLGEAQRQGTDPGGNLTKRGMPLLMRRFFAGIVSAVPALALIAACLIAQTPVSRAVDSRDRTLSMYNIHNGERISVQFRKDGKYVQAGLEKLNYFFRDWRTNVPTKMDPNLFDIIWEIHEELGSRVPIHLVSGYRSPGTNASLRKRGGGQAKFSKHTLGQASDIHFPDVPAQRIRYSAMVRERGGVGYYPTSAVPFVHVDTGRVRMWPRMQRQELALLFPNGRSKYVPADGRPIGPADVKLARSNYVQLASAIAAFHEFRAGAKDQTLVASLEPQMPIEDQSVSSQDDDADLTDGAVAAAPEPQAAERLVVAAASSDAVAADDGMPTLDGPALSKTPKKPQPNIQVASVDPSMVPKPVAAARPIQAASLGNMPQRVGLDRLISKLDVQAKVTLPTRSANREEALQPADGAMIIPEPQPASQQALLSRVGWASAPEYDDDHDSELSYRAFPLGPLLSRKPSMDDPVLATLRAPDLAQARDLIGRSEELGLGFLPRWQVAELPWGDQITSEDLSLVLTRSSAGVPGKPVKTALR
jgi:uncharacterized protein YcbK (DUF882 family)